MIENKPTSTEVEDVARKIGKHFYWEDYGYDDDKNTEEFLQFLLPLINPIIQQAELRGRIDENDKSIYASTQVRFAEWQLARRRELQAQLTEGKEANATE